MGWFLLSYLIFHLLFSHFPSYTCSLCHHHDYSALLLFKNQFALNPFNDYPSDCDCPASSKTESWKNGTDCCHWDGVKCHPISGHVIRLDLSCSNLQGQLHPNSTIFHLRHLQRLNLACNDFSGSSIGSGIGDLVNLTHLSLSYSGIGGDIPSTISHLSKLVSLDLSCVYEDCKHMRLFPSTWNKLIHNATNLRELNLEGVDMSSIGERSLSLLTNMSSSLISLGLYETRLQGKLPSDIFRLPNLQELGLSSDEGLKGELPKSNWTSPLTYLALSGISFSGGIPNSISHLKSLNRLHLENCSFDGPIPSSLFYLTQLSHLDLSWNSLVGPISSNITKFSKLQFLDLSHNILNGTIPYWCYSLPSLLVLDLSDNHLTGSISEFSTYSLHNVGLSYNKLEGNFPNSIFKLENLSSLSMSSTDISGVVDFHHFSKLKNLYLLNLSRNNFLSINFDTGVQHMSPKLGILILSYCNMTSFPQFLAPLQDLHSLDLSNNKIHGKIPEWFHEKLFHSWKNIVQVDLSFNQLQGDLPIPPNGIVYFLASNNNFSGGISSTVCNASSLNILNLARNNLTGTIPQCLGTLPFLVVLDLHMNNLHGNMPTNCSEQNILETIKLSGNRLEGPLPKSLEHCTNLEVLDLAENNIEDTFPIWIQTLPRLKVLSLRTNKFHGVITCFNIKHPFPQLTIFDVSNNRFSGLLPESCIKNFQGMMSVNDSQFGLEYMGSHDPYNESVVVVMKGSSVELVRILTTFTHIDLSNNMFEGEIPQGIGELNSLKGLNLSHNRIIGTIPQSLSNLRNLESLDLSWNRLTGEIPVALTNLNFLARFNLSQNQLEGIIPTGRQFNTFGNDSYAGNPMLCGIPMSKSCDKDEEWLPHSTLDHEESGFGWKAVVVGYACGMLFGMLLGYNVFFNGKPQWLLRLVQAVFNGRVKRANQRVTN